MHLGYFRGFYFCASLISLSRYDPLKGRILQVGTVHALCCRSVCSFWRTIPANLLHMARFAWGLSALVFVYSSMEGKYPAACCKGGCCNLWWVQILHHTTLLRFRVSSLSVKHYASLLIPEGDKLCSLASEVVHIKYKVFFS